MYVYIYTKHPNRSLFNACKIMLRYRVSGITESQILLDWFQTNTLCHHLRRFFLTSHVLPSFRLKLKVFYVIIIRRILF